MNAKMVTVLIAPAVTDHGSQCRIYARDGKIDKPLIDYRANPNNWKEVGLMNASGRLVCLESIGDLAQEMRDCEPMYGGMCFYTQVTPTTTPE